MNLAEWMLARGKARNLGHPAIAFFDEAGCVETLSYEALDAEIRRFAGGFQAAGLQPGDRVALDLGNAREMPLAFFGAIGAGLVAIPLSDQLTEPEVRRVAEDADISAIISTRFKGFDGVIALGTGALAQSEDAGFAPTGAEDPAFMVYTSGTSGKPKGVVHAQRSILGRVPMVDGWTGIEPGDRLLHVGAFNWTYTLGVGLMDVWASGATAVRWVGKRPEPRDWPRIIEQTEATVFAAVPSLYRQILKYTGPGALRFATLKRALSAGEALSTDLLHEWQERTSVPLLESLGMSEISTYISTGPGMAQKPGSPGRPQPGRRIAVLPEDGAAKPLATGDVGVLAVHRSDPGLFLKYWNEDANTGAFRADWFLTGDRASIDRDGYVWFHGRADDVMTVLGYRVAPQEVEAALTGVDCVSEFAVAERAVNDKQLIAAFVVTEAAFSKAVAALQARAEAALARYKRPHIYLRVKSLPRTASGKLKRKSLQNVPILETSN
ncbi:MAG: AMP-binding protein [Pseudomonadota bacterium]